LGSTDGSLISGVENQGGKDVFILRVDVLGTNSQVWLQYGTPFDDNPVDAILASGTSILCSPLLLTFNTDGCIYAAINTNNSTGVYVAQFCNRINANPPVNVAAFVYLFYFFFA
jgi:hypothetical protein